MLSKFSPRAVGKQAPQTCRKAVIKIASRCNLNCSYCYMYNMGDSTYLKQPAVMSNDVIMALMARVKDHCLCHGIRKFSFIFHGGEPLLAGVDFFRFFVERSRNLLPGEIETAFSMQTNGTLLTREWCGLLKQFNIRVGVSIDGPQRQNDRLRVDHAGRGSYERVKSGWANAQESGLDPGILTVIDLETDPAEVYSHLKQLRPHKVDFLFPQATYDNRPPGGQVDSEDAPYADWLLRIFSLWHAEDVPPFRIRLFDQIIGSVLGAPGHMDALGTGENQMLMIETDGAIETVDVLRVCGDGMTRNTYNVTTHSFDDALRDELVQLYYFSNLRLCAACQHCPINKICGGGYLPNRYSAARGFDNPSIYCRDLEKLIRHVYRTTTSDLRRARRCGDAA